MKQNTRIQFIMSASLALALSAANVAQAKAPARSSAGTDPGLSRRSLANATYPIDGAPGGAVTLTNGKYDNPEARYKATLVGPRAVGDLNGDDELDAAVTLVVDSGGSGTFTYVCAVLNDNGQANPVDCTFIGDRIRMQRITIQNGQINVHYLDRKPSQPMSARPTVRKTLVFALEGNQLVEQTSGGAVPAPAATAATLAGRYTAPNLPAADAAGRVIVLDLLADSKAVMTTQFIGKGEPIVNEGRWKQDSDKAVVALNSNQPQTLTFQLKGNQLVLLDPAQAGYGTEGLTLTRTPSGQTNSAEYGGASLSFDADLAKSAQGATVPAVPVSEGPALGGGSPEHIRFLFDGAKPPEYFDVRLPQVEVYSTESLRALDPSVAKTVDELQALLAKKPPPAELTGWFTNSIQIPVFPPIPASQVFRVKPRYIDFKNGAGIGFVTYYAQDVSPVTKDRIFYTFQGLTTDGMAYVTAFWPVTTELLPATPEAALGGQSYEQWAQGYDEYLTNLTKALDGLLPAAYTPDLLLIDGLVQSISVGQAAAAGSQVGTSAVTATNTVQFTCADGKQVQIVFSNGTATVSFNGQAETLTQKETGSGIDYANDKWEWRGKGEEGFLAEAGTGTILAGDCKTDNKAIASTETMTMTTGLSGVLTGTVTYLRRIALPPNAVVEVTLADVSKQDVAATVIASQTIATKGAQVPIPYELKYDRSTIDPRFSYAVSARITVDGKLAWTSTTRNSVLTRGAPVTGVEIIVQKV